MLAKIHDRARNMTTPPPQKKKKKDFHNIQNVQSQDFLKYSFNLEYETL